MTELDETLVTHKLFVAKDVKPVIQIQKNFSSEIQLQIKAEIEKLLKFGFIKICLHAIWLAKIIPVKKKNGEIRISVDYRDLNLNTLVDAPMGHEILLFMDRFIGYNQIRMALKDAEKKILSRHYLEIFITHVCHLA